MEFDGTGSYDLDGTIVKYDWDFGDGETGKDNIVTHAYKKAGKYTVTLIVTDDQSVTDKATVEITIIQPPQADFTFSPSKPEEGSEVTFNDISTPKEEINSWKWDFGDGTSSTEQKEKHTFSADGIYKVTLQVTSSNGLESSITRDVNVTNVPPTAKIVEPLIPPTIIEGSTVSFRGDFTDPGSDDRDATFEWDLGDGAKGKGKEVEHKYTKKGTFTVTLTVTDSDGAKGKSTMLVTVKLPKPEVILKPEYPFPLDTLIAEITKPSSDVENDQITYTYEWFKNEIFIKRERTKETNLSLPPPFTAGDVWQVKVTPNDGKSDGEVAASPSVTIRPSIEEHLFHNYPNPFNPKNGTTFVFYLKQANSVDIRVYDLRGKLIRKLRETTTQIGRNEVFWNGKDEEGYVVPSAVYICHIEISPEGERIQPNPLKIVAWR
jgi:PKD repeat protein